MPGPQDIPARLAAAVERHQTGDIDAAEESYLAILADDPNCTDAHKMMALVALGRGDFDEALTYLGAALDLAPDVGEYWHLLGRIHLEIGDLDAASDALEKAVTRAPMDPFGAQLDLSLCHARRGDWQSALTAAESAMAIDPGNIYALRAAANAALTIGNDALAENYFDRALAADPRDAGTLEGLSRLDRKRNDPVSALNRLDRAVKLEPDNAEYAYMRRVVAAEAVPAWHFNMMNDDARNQAFAAAIARQVKPGSVVFEIGAGAGLLAMMAARAGGRVYTCELNPAIAAVARDIIGRNGLGAQITVIEKPSWQVMLGHDLPKPADVLIAEIFSAQLLSEDVLPSLEDAKARLLAPSAAVIPAVGVMRGAIVESESLNALTRMGHVAGFDLSPFNTFTPPLMNLDAPNTALTWLSDPADLFAFDFQSESEWPAAEGEIDVPVTRNGVAQGVVQWLWLSMDGVTEYENPPLGPKGTRTPHWTPLLYTFPAPLALEAGQVVTLKLVHDRKGARADFVAVT